MGIVAAILSTVLNETKKEFALLVRILAVVLLGATALNLLSEKISEFTQMLETLCEYPKLISVMVKGVVISIVSALSSDICNECGNMAVAKAIHLLGRIMILLLAYPFLEVIIKTAISFAGE